MSSPAPTRIASPRPCGRTDGRAAPAASAIDLLFFDTTSTYFERDEADEPQLRNERGELADEQDAVRAAGFRTYGHSKDHRGDLPQVVVGMAVTREGIPVRVWSWPGNTADSALIRQVKEDLAGWTLSRIVWACDRGFTSEENRRFLRRGDEHCILGEKLRSGSAEAVAALARAGRKLYGLAWTTQASKCEAA